MIRMIRNIRQLLGSQAPRMIGPMLLSALESMLNSVTYGVMIMALLGLTEKTFTAASLKQYTVILAVVFLTRWLLQAIGFTGMQCIGADYTRKLRIDVANHIRSLNLGFFNKNSIGRLNSTLLADITDFENIITHCICDFVKVVVFTILALAISFQVDWRFGLTALLLIAAAFPFLGLSGRAAAQNAVKLRETHQKVITRIVEYVAGIKTFRLYNLTGERFVNLDQALQDMKEKSTRSELTILPFAVSFSSLTALLVPAALLIGSWLVYQTAAGLPQFLIIVLLAISLVSMMGVLGSLYPQVRSLTKATDNILAILHETPMPYSRAETDFREYPLQFQDVHFRYNDDTEILKGLNFTVKAGTTTALIGPSGSGKSTVVSLIARFWDVTAGQIMIDRKNIRDYAPDALNANISIVFQEVYLLNDTVLNNIRIGRPDATMAEVIEAAEAAHCHEFIGAMEHGYETIIGEGGSTLSGGEKQRISIARALLKDSPIVLLDETTSSLDADNEQQIHLAFDRLMKDKTVLVIAHRLKTIINADNILVLKKGEIIESGNHQKLIGKNGWYARMIANQKKAQEWTVVNAKEEMKDA